MSEAFCGPVVRPINAPRVVIKSWSDTCTLGMMQVHQDIPFCQDILRHHIGCRDLSLGRALTFSAFPLNPSCDRAALTNCYIATQGSRVIRVNGACLVRHRCILGSPVGIRKRLELRPIVEPSKCVQSRQPLHAKLHTIPRRPLQVSQYIFGSVHVPWGRSFKIRREEAHSYGQVGPRADHQPVQ